MLTQAPNTAQDLEMKVRDHNLWYNGRDADRNLWRTTGRRHKEEPRIVLTIDRSSAKHCIEVAEQTWETLNTMAGGG